MPLGITQHKDLGVFMMLDQIHDYFWLCCAIPAVMVGIALWYVWWK